MSFDSNLSPLSLPGEATLGLRESSVATAENSNPNAFLSLRVSWRRIVSYFDDRYDRVYSNTSAKAHLDMSEAIIDGAKERWRHILLFDTIVSFFLGKERGKQDCERRRFDQYTVFKDCVITACSEALVVAQMSHDYVENRISTHCEIIDIPWEWTTNDNLRTHLLSNRTSKSWKKRLNSVELLCNNMFVVHRGVMEIVKLVTNRIFSQDFLNPSILDLSSSPFDLRNKIPPSYGKTHPGFVHACSLLLAAARSLETPDVSQKDVNTDNSLKSSEESDDSCSSFDDSKEKDASEKVVVKNVKTDGGEEVTCSLGSKSRKEDLADNLSSNEGSFDVLPLDAEELMMQSNLQRPLEEGDNTDAISPATSSEEDNNNSDLTGFARKKSLKLNGDNNLISYEKRVRSPHSCRASPAWSDGKVIMSPYLPEGKVIPSKPQMVSITTSGDPIRKAASLFQRNVRNLASCDDEIDQKRKIDTSSTLTSSPLLSTKRKRLMK